MNQVVFAAGELWAGVNTSIASEDDARLGIAWFAVSPSVHDGEVSASVQHQGYVSVAGQNVIYPSIGVNQNGTRSWRSLWSVIASIPRQPIPRLRNEATTCALRVRA